MADARWSAIRVVRYSRVWGFLRATLVVHGGYVADRITSEEVTA
jgi:hypothetical protein